MIDESSAPLADTAPSESPNTDTPSAPQGTPEAAPAAGPAATPSPEAAPAGDPRTNITPTETPAEDGFAIPETYQRREHDDGKVDNAWTDKVKSTEDLWKMTANLQEMVGKKHAIPDFENATPEQIDQYFNQVRPENPTDYNFNHEEGVEMNEVETALAGIIHESGLPKFQADKLIAGYQALEQEQHNAMFSKDAFFESMEGHFGKDFENKINETRQVIEGNLTEDQRAVLNEVPNQYLALIYQLASNMNQSYGASETGTGGNHNAGSVPVADVGVQRSDLRKQIQDMSKDPFHDGAKRQQLIEQLNNTYQ